MQQTDVLVQAVEHKKKSQEFCDFWCVISQCGNSYKTSTAQYSSKKICKRSSDKECGNLTKYSVARILYFSPDLGNQESFIFSVAKVLGFFPFES